MNRIMCSLIFFASLAACQRTADNPLRQPAYFGKVYAQVLLATQIAEPNKAAADSNGAWRRARIDSVLASRQLTRAQLNDAVQYFSADPQRWQEVYQVVVNELDSLSLPPHYPPKKPSQKN